MIKNSEPKYRHTQTAQQTSGVGKNTAHGERDIGGDRAVDHLARQGRLGGEDRA
jgi:hypothetical protein